MKKLGLYSIIISSFLVSCESTVKDPSDNDFTKVLVKEGFVPYIMPSSLEGPGALISIDSETGAHQWIGDLSSCGFEKWGKIRVTEGKYPKFNGKKKVEFNLSALAKLLKFGSGEAGAGYVKKAQLSIDWAGKQTLDYYALTNIYLNKDKREQLNPMCLDDINTGNVRLVSVAAYVKEGKFEFFSDANASVKVKANELMKKAEFDAGFGAKADGESAMVIDEIIYIAFKEARKFPVAGTLGPDGKVEWEDTTQEVLNVLANSK